MGGNKVAQLATLRRELADAIRADTVDTHLGQGFPLVGSIGGPGDHPRPRRVRADHQILVDERGFLPEIPGAGGDDCGDGIDMSRDLQHAGGNGWEERLHVLGYAVVKRVYGAHRARVANAPDDERLDVARLDLDVNEGSLSDDCEDRGQAGNLDPFGERKTLQLVRGEIGDTGLSGAVERLVVMHDDESVPGGMHVELDGVGAAGDRLLEGRNGVLGQAFMRTPVGDGLGPGTG